MIPGPGDGPPIAKLPFQIRPIAGEGGPAFITRLARANQLPPAYLRKFLAKPPLHRGIPSWDRLAAVTGRDADQLRVTLETRQCRECGTDIPPSSAFGRRAFLCSVRCRDRISRKRFTKAPCRICQKPMRIRIGQRHRLCSSPCRRRAYLIRQGALTAEGEEPAADRACLACERPLAPGSLASRRTCSNPCRQQVIRWKQLDERDHPSGSFSACAFCRTPIQSDPPASPLRRWCSSRCRQRGYRRLDPTAYLGLLTCEHCQTSFERGSSGRARRWCSTQCRIQARALQAPPRPAKSPAARQVKTATLNCPRCEDSFESTASRGCPWCSTRCWNDALNQRLQQIACGVCATSLSNRRPHDTRRWCSGACRQKAVRWRKELSTRRADTADRVPSQ